MLEAAEPLINNGFHPLKINESFELGCSIAIENLCKISKTFEFSNDKIEPLVRTCMTTLSPKIVNRCKRALGEVCVRALLAIADLNRGEVNLDLIKVESKSI